MTTEIKTYNFKKGLPQEFEIVDLSKFYKRNFDILTTVHRTGFYQIIWFQNGNPTLWVDFKAVHIQPNTVLFLNKDVVKQLADKTPFEGISILFTDSFYCQTEIDTRYLRNTILFNDLLSVSQIQVQKQIQLFAGLVQQMIGELNHTKDNFQEDILQNLLHNFLLHAERIRRTQGFTEIKKGADLDYVMLFKDLLEAHYKEQKQVSYYARQILITEKRLNQATTKVLGKTPKEIIDDRIMLEAKRLLAHTNESIKEVGFSLGFEEPTNFIKYFKKHALTTPTEFRENLRLD
ncbi:helix-turn-helix domain-containing protein [Pseudoflavitalea sp. X16]|uniref:AraC family transcriptional regulator n=1 Tax=Paraflavitalea devenefica TaxID=2716334 RepID=UPI0014201AFD|nr:helix-turn-helix transcriptional regulator [Paraflavitalea devenefica]NII24337.1 helix-turn-helix domain-containing protein [Paraflavitalea devenefica]